jgi:hypothetical protein
MPSSLSTILYVDDVPVGYEVTREGGMVLFTPTRFTEKTCCPPTFSVVREEEGYHFSDAVTDDIRTQAEQALEQLQTGKLLE